MIFLWLTGEFSLFLMTFSSYLVRQAVCLHAQGHQHSKLQNYRMTCLDTHAHKNTHTHTPTYIFSTLQSASKSHHNTSANLHARKIFHFSKIEHHVRMTGNTLKTVKHFYNNDLFRSSAWKGNMMANTIASGKGPNQARWPPQHLRHSILWNFGLEHMQKQWEKCQTLDMCQLIKNLG